MKSRFFSFILVILFLTALGYMVFVVWQKSAPDYSTVSFGRGVNLVVEIADTQAKHERGLSYRESIDLDAGMLFVYDEPAVRAFWMKGMLFPIDIIWLNDGVVVGSEKDAPVPPEHSGFPPATFYSPVPVDMVLEVNAGFVEKYGIESGHPVEIRLDAEGE